jgi:hypothetical protein
MKDSPQEKFDGTLKRSIDVYLQRVIAWLLKRFPDGYRKIFGGERQIHGVHFYLFLKVGFYDVAKTKLVMGERGFRPMRSSIVDPATGNIFHSVEEYEKATGKYWRTGEPVV